MKTTLKSGNTETTLTTNFTLGSGWMLEKNSSWNGQESEKQNFAGATWRESEKECENDLLRMTKEMEETGWTKK